ncbi:hypothetical protein HGRIS_003294 [Hohenbuehelia grisea]|uniref:Uncharacterized protein n=1 Tax=Hohenbuehelia grisea TaxID=104357 RepID=A0ABR3JFK6_9AGAR
MTATIYATRTPAAATTDLRLMSHYFRELHVSGSSEVRFGITQTCDPKPKKEKKMEKEMKKKKKKACTPLIQRSRPT